MHANRVLLLSALVLAACGGTRPRPDGRASADQSPGAGSSLSIEERRLLDAATIALPPGGLAADSLPDARSVGAQMLVAYCTQCHALPSPAMHGAVDWPAVARRMWVRIDMMHGELGVRSPSEAERMQLLGYLTSHALQVTAHLPPGIGRDVFQVSCSRCHLLPDPRGHSPADWPAVVTRMERNMERMKVSGVTHDQAQAIIGYLRVASRR